MRDTWLHSIYFPLHSRGYREGRDGAEGLIVITSNQYTVRNVIASKGAHQGLFLPELAFFLCLSDKAEAIFHNFLPLLLFSS